MRLPIIINSSIGKRASYAANESCRLSRRAFNHRRRQQKRCGSRHLYRYAGCLSGAAFPPADYIALGHIHRAQCVGGTEHIRYCGSPIALSFDECGKSKCVHLVTFEQEMAKYRKSGCPRDSTVGGFKGDRRQLPNSLSSGAALSNRPRLAGY